MSTQETQKWDTAAPAAHQSTLFASGRLMAWRGVDLITAAMLAVAFGVAFWSFDTFVYPAVAALAVGSPGRRTCPGCLVGPGDRGRSGPAPSWLGTTCANGSS